VNSLEIDDPSALNISTVDGVRRPFLQWFQSPSIRKTPVCFIFSRFSAAIFLANATIPGTINI
jgi:hypothetical protein